MQRFIAILVLSTLAGSGAQALSLGPEEFAAADRLTCVLAQQSLGYLNDEEYAEMTELVLDEYDQTESDVIYAKALGYYHGLMFGINNKDERQVSRRTIVFLNSQACTTNTNVTIGLAM